MDTKTIRLVKDDLDNCYQFADAARTIYYRMAKPIGFSKLVYELVNETYVDSSLDKDGRRKEVKELEKAKQALVEAAGLFQVAYDNVCGLKDR